MSEDKHAVERTISVITVLAVLGLVGFVLWSVYVAIIKPHTNPTRTTDQHAEQINNPTYSPKPGIGGCAHMTINNQYGKAGQ
jgi:cytoskeletal protein RodZ